MLEQLRERSSGEEKTLGPSERRDVEKVVFEGSVFRAGRALFGGILAFMALDNLRNLEERIGYADAKGAPAPQQTVPASSAGLLAGGLGVTLWRLPRASATLIATFFASTTPIMHDFWNVEDAEQQQQEVFHFMKNIALMGAALVLVQLGGQKKDEE